MKNVFDILTDKYDAWYDSEDGRPLYESELKCLSPMVEASPKPILEIGVGTGRFAMHFPDVIGVDHSLNALKMAGKRGAKTGAFPIFCKSWQQIFMAISEPITHPLPLPRGDSMYSPLGKG